MAIEHGKALHGATLGARTSLGSSYCVPVKKIYSVSGQLAGPDNLYGTRKTRELLLCSTKGTGARFIKNFTAVCTKKRRRRYAYHKNRRQLIIPKKVY